MAFRYRKSVNLGGGVRLNLSKRGVGLSAGVKGLRYSVSSSGRRTRTVSVPGTGASWVSSTKGKRVATEQSGTPAVRAGALGWVLRHKVLSSVAGLLVLGAVGNAVDPAPAKTTPSSLSSPEPTFAPEVVATSAAPVVVSPAASSVRRLVTASPKPRVAAVVPLATRPKPVAPVATTAPVKAAAPAPVAPAATRYANCAALNQDYPHGVGRPGAVDHTSGSAPVTTFTVDDRVYEANTARDRDKDGIACEKA